MSKIITTIGPASESSEVLQYFKDHKVQIARLNFSHNVVDWHIQTGLKARQVGLELMVDLAGPKILVGELGGDLILETGKKVIIEFEKFGQTYPYNETINGEEMVVIPSYLEFAEFVEVGKAVLIDDGKVELQVSQKIDNRLICDIIFGSKVRSHKGINLPGSDVKIDFLVERDREFLTAVLPVLMPEYVAPSFVKTFADVEYLETFMKEILTSQGITDYFPKIVTKVEMEAAVSDENLPLIVGKSDIIMIARGDLALETYPLHVRVPFLQEKIKQECLKQKTPFVVATQILESMFSSPVPCRAEVSDLYRAVVLDKADFVMLSGESAAGGFAKECVKLMETMIDFVDKQG
jgi:pyruvate kinase